MGSSMKKLLQYKLYGNIVIMVDLRLFMNTFTLDFIFVNYVSIITGLIYALHELLYTI